MSRSSFNIALMCIFSGFCVVRRDKRVLILSDNLEILVFMPFIIRFKENGNSEIKPSFGA